MERGSAGAVTDDIPNRVCEFGGVSDDMTVESYITKRGACIALPGSVPELVQCSNPNPI